MSVIFASLGPGDPQLVTLKALAALQAADRVFCPAGAGGSRAAEVLDALSIAPEKIRLCSVPMSRDRSAAGEAYRRAAEEIADAFREGLKVVVAAEGDAGFYATADYIADELAARGIPTERIPGVAAFLACGALAGISVTRGDEGLEVVPGTLDPGRLQAKLAEGRTVAVMKASRCEAALKQAVRELSGAEFHYFENAGVAGREFYSSRPEEILAREFPYFSLMIVRATRV